MSVCNFLMLTSYQLRCRLSCYNKVDLIYSVLRVIEVYFSLMKKYIDERYRAVSVAVSPKVTLVVTISKPVMEDKENSKQIVYTKVIQKKSFPFTFDRPTFSHMTTLSYWRGWET